MAKQQFDPKEFQKQTQETLSVIQDTLTSFAANLATAMKQSIHETGEEADRVVKKTVSGDLTKAFKDVKNQVEDMANMNDKFVKGQVTSQQIRKQRFKLEEKLAKLDRARSQAQKYQTDLSDEELEVLADTKHQLDEIYKAQEKAARKLENRVGGLVGIFDRLSNIPIAKDLLNSKAAAEAMKEHLLEGGSSMVAFGKGIKAAFQGIEKASVVLLLIKGVVEAFKFVVKMFTMSRDLAVDFGTALGTSNTEAERLKNNLGIAFQTGKESYFTYTNSAKVLGVIKNEYGSIALESGKTLENATFLMHRVGIAGDEMARLNLLFTSAGKDSKLQTENINELVKHFAKLHNFAVPLDVVLQDISQASGEMASYYSFSAEALATAALKTRQFGLALSNTKSIAEGLLDFEKSITEELQLRVLTGKDINLNAARLAAFNGDSAEATKLILEQMKKIPAEQRKLPVVMNAMASAANMTAEELNKAFMLSNKYKDTKEAINQADLDEMKDRVKTADKFTEILNNLQEKFSTLFPETTIQSFINAVEDFAIILGGFAKRAQAVGVGEALMGGGYAEAAFADLEKRIKEVGSFGLTERESRLEQVMYAYQKEMRKGILSNRFTVSNLNRQAQYLSTVTDEEYKNAKLLPIGVAPYKGEQKVDDFTIRTNPKDTLVMAGGTKFGEETNALLKELVTAVKSGGNVYIDGRKVGESMALSYVSTN